MKADVIFGRHEFIGVYGKDEEEIKSRIADEHGLSEYGKSKLIVIERND